MRIKNSTGRDVTLRVEHPAAELAIRFELPHGCVYDLGKAAELAARVADDPEVDVDATLEGAKRVRVTVVFQNELYEADDMVELVEGPR